MIAALTNHLWQSTLFAALVWIVTLALRENRAHVRFWLWFSASLKFLVPFALLTTLGGYLALTPPARSIATNVATPIVSPTIVRISQPFSGTVSRAPSAVETADRWPDLLFAIWLSGFLYITVMRVREGLRIRAAVRASTVSDIAAPVPVRSSPWPLEPGIVGLWRPILLVPDGIEKRLTAPQLEAVLAHEMCHVRRRDNLLASIHMIVEAAFWFHPLVWWIGARLMDERERACDEEVLRLGSDPRVYAEGILNVCKLYAESPLQCIAGITGSNIKKRIEVIMANRVVLKLNFARRVALVVVGCAVLTVPVVIGVLNAPAVRAQGSAASVPQFKEVSIRLCGDAPGLDGPVAAPVPVGGSGGVPPPPPRPMSDVILSAPGTLKTGCMPLVAVGDQIGLIQHAYDRYADASAPRPWAATVPVEGGPSWVRSDLYEISAKADGSPSEELMRGPMMQALLEDRFKLKIRRTAREAPVYALTVAPAGLRLTRFQGGCIVTPPTATPPSPPRGERYCQDMIGSRPPTIHAEGSTLTDFSHLLNLVLDRPVVDKTGIAGRFDINLQFGIDGMTPRFLPGGDMAHFAQPDPAAQPILRAMQQLGLQLEPASGQREFLVIDHMERP